MLPKKVNPRSLECDLYMERWREVIRAPFLLLTVTALSTAYSLAVQVRGCAEHRREHQLCLELSLTVTKCYQT